MKLRAIPIEMIGWFDFKGQLKPISFKFTIGREIFKGKILNIQERHKELFCGNPMEVFTCLTELNGQERLVEFKYEVNTHKWMLFKM